MKIKSLFFIIFVSFIIFIIYINTIDKKIYYVDISIEKNKYNLKILNKIKEQKKLEKNINILKKGDYRITDLIRNIKENKKINNQTIQNILIKADILTLNIGNNEINYLKIKDNNYKYIDEILIDMEELFKLIRVYCKEKIYIIGFKNNIGISYTEYFEYINKRLKYLSNNYNIIYIENNNNIYQNIKFK